MIPKIYTADDHHIRNDLIDPNALYVLKKLHEAGFLAYLVGGSVRDLLMRKRPKDFDISTSARPEELKQLFRSCILVGRRFPLAHVRFGKHIIEVSTFRSGDPQGEELIVKDNLWGTPEEDVLRRDFTINGLYYDPLDHRIIDYVGGFEDLQAHLLRTIGDPKVRFKQDPVRMIRMQKFQARFGFHVQPQALEALLHCREEIVKSSPARLLEEIFRMLESGSSEPFFKLLYEFEFLKILFPSLHHYFGIEQLREFIYTYLKAADSMNQRTHYRSLDRSILASALIYPILCYELERLKEESGSIPHLGQILDLIHRLTHHLVFDAFSHFPRKIRLGMQFILQMQYRITPLDKRKKPRLNIVKQKEFPIALIFLKLRSLIDHSLFKTYEHWKLVWKEQLDKKEETQS